MASNEKRLELACYICNGTLTGDFVLASERERELYWRELGRDSTIAYITNYLLGNKE